MSLSLNLRERDKDEMICFIQMPMDDMEVSTSIKINGVLYELTGKPARVLNIETPLLVELLSKDSTPQNQKLRQETLGDFISLVEEMPKNEQKFATVLRSNWPSTAALWSLEKN